VTYPVIQVFANLPGASPDTMATAVATPLERMFGRIAGSNQERQKPIFAPFGYFSQHNHPPDPIEEAENEHDYDARRDSRRSRPRGATGERLVSLRLTCSVDWSWKNYSGQFLKLLPRSLRKMKSSWFASALVAPVA
jgi:hypothetical protein